MSYNIIIGNAEPDFGSDCGELYAQWIVKERENEDAPKFPNDELTGKSNGRYPGYSQWSGFCKICGLHDLFFDKWEGLMVPHPGCKIINRDHYQQVVDALEKWKITSTLPPGFGKDPVFNDQSQDWEYPDSDKYDPILARLIWLEYWMKWALENCKIPAIYNS